MITIAVTGDNDYNYLLPVSPIDIVMNIIIHT